MIILAIETSCDDTCVALLEIRNWKPRTRTSLVRGKLKILSNIVSSQVKLHAKYGGVYPSLAKREHQKNLPIVFKKALQQTQSKQIDLIAVTVGPGLEPCLWVGVNFVKELAQKLNLSIVPVNHIEAHIFANFLNSKFSILNSKYLFPAICLVVSGGHTQLILMRDIGDYKLLGETRDDATGECFDKTARILGLGYPGGPAIDEQAWQWRNRIEIPTIHTQPKFEIKLPRPMICQKNYDFSFSGLKTAVLYDFKSRSLKAKKSKEYIQEISAEAQQAMIDVLIKKTLKAAKDYRAKAIVLGGGVAASEELRKQFQDKIQKEMPDTKYLIPNTQYCTDNAVMVGIVAYFNWLNKKQRSWQKIMVDANLKIGI